MSVLVTGGAGFIGAHVVEELRRRGQPVVVVDNLSTGHRAAVHPDVPFVQTDIVDADAMADLICRHRVKSVMHFAAKSIVAESYRSPREYYIANFDGTRALVETALRGGVRKLVFSSTAAVYGMPRETPIDEEHPTKPVNPYGATKLAIEHFLESYSHAYGLKYVALRYFNAAGAEPSGNLLERHHPETHLIPLVLEVALGKREAITIHGTDYGTKDGTCIRDYIHVCDLADAHVAALRYLSEGGDSNVFNLGTARGYSVKEVISASAFVTGVPIPVVEGRRRDGDPDVLVAGFAKAQRVLGWSPRYTLQQMIAHAWHALQKHQDQGRDRHSVHTDAQDVTAEAPTHDSTRETDVRLAPASMSKPTPRRPTRHTAVSGALGVAMNTPTKGALSMLEHNALHRGSTSELDAPDVLCFSHLRWGFVFQRPNHLMSRCAQSRRVFFWEEPILDSDKPFVEMQQVEPRLWVLTPHLPPTYSEDDKIIVQRELLRRLMAEQSIRTPVLWFYTPMMLPLADRIAASSVVYDCMDELSAFAGASPALKSLESQLMKRADIVFTGGHSLYHEKRRYHENAHAFPSSVDRPHFARALEDIPEPDDQRQISGPKLGFFGVIDERMDVHLLRALSSHNPDWQIVVIGPVVKIDEATLPRNKNIHYLGKKSYQELPHYLRGWNVALMPFAINEATRFISPTKTLEYLAAGLPVVSTPIRDVVDPYGKLGLVRIGTGKEFLEHAQAALGEEPSVRRPAIDAYLQRTSWDQTWSRMDTVIQQALQRKAQQLTITKEAMSCLTTSS